jgi:nucleoside-diphosphate-sugar epimerase
MRRVLVLGATSLIGRRLLGDPPPDVQLLAVSRRPPEGGNAGLTWVAADLADPGLRLPQADAVLSLSPIWLLAPALAAVLATGARRLVAFSSTSRITKARSPVAGERAVAARLADGEAAVIAACTAAGVAWTLLRPTLIYAEGEDRNVSRLAGLVARFGVLPLAGRGEGLRQPVHAADLARAALQAMDASAAFDRTYDLPGGETLTYRAMAVRIFEALGRRPRLLSLPPPLWRLGLALAAPLLPGATAAMGARMSEDLTFDAAPAARDFGYAPRPFRPAFARPVSRHR